MSDFKVSFEEFCDSIVKFGEIVREISIPFCRMVEALTNYTTAYDRARKSNKKWVWYAEHHKKRRIRKKYHKKIMETYGGEANGKTENDSGTS